MGIAFAEACYASQLIYGSEYMWCIGLWGTAGCTSSLIVGEGRISQPSDFGLGQCAYKLGKTIAVRETNRFGDFEFVAGKGLVKVPVDVFQLVHLGQLACLISRTQRMFSSVTVMSAESIRNGVQERIAYVVTAEGRGVTRES
jgi:hypothetical protein